MKPTLENKQWRKEFDKRLSSDFKPRSKSFVDENLFGEGEEILFYRIKKFISQLLQQTKLETIMEIREAVGGEWIDNPNGEVSLYTCGRRDERKEIIKNIDLCYQVINNTKDNG